MSLYVLASPPIKYKQIRIRQESLKWLGRSLFYFSNEQVLPLAFVRVATLCTYSFLTGNNPIDISDSKAFMLVQPSGIRIAWMNSPITSHQGLLTFIFI